MVFYICTGLVIVLTSTFAPTLMWDMRTEVVRVTSLVPPNFCHSSTRGETFMYWSIYFSRCALCACLPQLIMASSKVMLGTLMHVSKVRVYNYTTCIVWNYWSDCWDCCMLCRPANSHGFIVGLKVLVLVSRSHRHTRKTRSSSTILIPTLLYLVWKVHIGDRETAWNPAVFTCKFQHNSANWTTKQYNNIFIEHLCKFT